MPYGLLAVIMTLNIWYKNLQFQYEIIGFVFFCRVETRKAMEDQLNLKNINNALAKKDELNQFYYQEYCNKFVTIIFC